MQYATETKIYFQVFVETTGEQYTGFLPSSTQQPQISKDGGAFVNTTNNVSNLPTNGLYTLVLTAAEMTCDSFVVAFAGSGFTVQPIIGETTRAQDTSALAADLAAIKGLAGNFSVSSNVLTAYNADGTTNAVYDLTRDLSGNITAIEPRSAT